MKKQLDKCINLLQIAKDASCSVNPNPDLAFAKLEEANGIIAKFNLLSKDDKKKYMEELLEIQALAKLVNHGLIKYKKQLEEKMGSSKKRAKAVKGYAAFM